MTPAETDQLLASRQPASITEGGAQPSQVKTTPSAPAMPKPGEVPLVEHRDDSEWRQLTPKEVAASATGPGKRIEGPTMEVSEEELKRWTKEHNLSFEVDAKPPGRFWQAVTWDLHLTASGLIIFVCLAIAKFWPAQRDNFSYLVGLAATYLIGNTTGKTLPTKDGE